MSTPKIKIRSFNYTGAWDELPDHWYWEWWCPEHPDYHLPEDESWKVFMDVRSHVNGRHSKEVPCST